MILRVVTLPVSIHRPPTCNGGRLRQEYRIVSSTDSILPVASRCALLPALRRALLQDHCFGSLVLRLRVFLRDLLSAMSTRSDIRRALAWTLVAATLHASPASRLHDGVVHAATPQAYKWCPEIGADHTQTLKLTGIRPNVGLERSLALHPPSIVVDVGAFDGCVSRLRTRPLRTE